jgi:hypothetical protein
MMMGKTRDTRTIGGAIIRLNGITIKSQCRSKFFDNWEGGGAHIHIFVFTDHKNNRFQKKLITQNTNI